jgi:GntR family carbon starvation induced transcriptional regulator
MLNIMAKKPGRRDVAGQDPSTGRDLVARLRTDIVSSVFGPEARLKFAELTKRYDVGIGTLREALSQLVSEGFVSLEVAKGFRVVPVSREELIEITDHYVDFETRALVDAIAHGDDEWESRIVAAHHRLSIIESLPWTGRMARHTEWVERHREFHGSLASACRKQWVLRLRSLMFDQLDRYRFLTKSAPPGLGRRKFEEHRVIMNATLQRKVELATRLIEEHIRDTAAQALKSL